MSVFAMDEPFDLPDEYKWEEIIFPARLVKRGYSYKIHIEVNGQEIIFEPDEERNFRAIQENQNNSSVSIEMVCAIGETLEKYLH